MSRPSRIALGAVLGAVGLTALRIVVEALWGQIPGDEWFIVFLLVVFVISVPPGALLGGVTAGGLIALREGKRSTAGWTWAIGGGVAIAACVCMFLGCDGAGMNAESFVSMYGLPCTWGLGLIVAGVVALDRWG